MKKPRMSSPISDEDDEANGSFASRLSRFKKPALPAGRGEPYRAICCINRKLTCYRSSQGRLPNASSDALLSDSDYMPVPDESDADVPATSSRRGSSIAASRSELSSAIDSASEASDVPKKSKKSARPPPKKSQSSAANTAGTGGGSNSFLTAAEKRALDKKSEKKSADDPFEFLKDVRDVSA